jgi:hypothetical protein
MLPRPVMKMMGRISCRVPKRGLQVETAEPREPHVEHQARRAIDALAVEEGLGGGERLDREADRAHEPRQGPPHRLLVVHDVHGAVGRHRRVIPLTPTILA